NSSSPPRHRSQSPAKSSGPPFVRVTRWRTFTPPIAGYSTKAEAGTRHLRLRKESRKEGTVSTVSARALKVPLNRFGSGSVAQKGIRPQLIASNPPSPRRSRITGPRYRGNISDRVSLSRGENQVRRYSAKGSGTSGSVS